MKKTFILISVLFLSFLGFSQDIPPRPTPAKLVNDLYNLLSTDEVYQLESKLRTFMDSTSNQIAIVTLQTTGGYAIDDIALKIMREWGVGQKDKDNGVVILVAVEDRKIWISTGYGMEGALPDARCKQIIDQIIKPAFREKQYFKGFNRATDRMIQYTSGEYTNDHTSNTDGALIFVIIALFVLLLFILFIYLSVKAAQRRKDKGVVVSHDGWDEYEDQRRRTTVFPPIFWDGGGHDDNDSGGGGFGGFDFGGGSGGGGGAGGDW